MAPALIAIDLDGTLLDSDGGVSLRNRAALRLAEDAGAELVIATGRRHCYAMRVVRELPIAAASALISSNGTVIRTLDAKLLHRTHMDPGSALHLCQRLGSFRNALMLTFDTVGPTGEDSRGALVCEHMDELNTSITRWMKANQPYIQQVDSVERILAPGHPNGAPIQMMLCGTVSRMAAAEALLLEDHRVNPVGAPERPGMAITLHRTIYPNKDLSIVDILPAGSSKASALRQLAALRGVSLAETMAVGDNWNDLPMLRIAGHPVLLDNAPEDLKAIALQHHWTIAPANDLDGVAVAIEAAVAQVSVR